MTEVPSGFHGRRRQLLEIGAWLLVAVLIMGRFLIKLAASTMPVYYLLTEHYSGVLLAILVAMFPVLFKLTFGLLPIESVQQLAASRWGERRDDPQQVEATPPTAEGLMRVYAERSDHIAHGLYRRAGVYLMLGVMIAFSGLFFFYVQTNALQEQELKKLEIEKARGSSGAGEKQSAGAVLLITVAALAPRFGILFFIEFIAFFFLRQYRGAMDEFRYFEGVKRSREEMRAVLVLAAQPAAGIDIGKLIESGRFFSTSGKLAAGETTELIETRKLSRDELVLFEQIIAAISAGKGLSASK
jgi:hypothetical protein